MRVQADQYFAIIPEWVLYADISPAAVRVYGCLNRYANDSTGKCHPSRKAIAEKTRIGLSTVDRSIDELVKIGAIEVRHRKSPNGDSTSNEYTLKMNRPLSTVNRPSIKFEQTGLFKSDNQTIAILNQSQEPTHSTVVERGGNPIVEELAAEWWESREKKPLGKRAWWTLKSVVDAAVQRGYSPADIRAALNRYGTVPSIAAFDRELQRLQPPTPTPQPPKPAPIVYCGNCHNGWIETYDDALAPCPCTKGEPK